MSAAVCVTCGTQFAEAAPSACPICEDPRQYVPPTGQAWTTLDALRGTHRNRIAPQGELEGIGTEPSFGIGQRALLVPHGGRRFLWDCITLLDDATAEAVQARGGLTGVAISHPHYYSAMVEWAHRFECPVHLHADDRAWIQRPDPAIALWEGETLDLGDGLTLVRCGGHFPGATVLHHAAGSEGRGTLLAGDIVLPVPDHRYVAMLWSYPNRVPLPAGAAQGIADALAPFAFDALHCAFWDDERRDAKAMIERSAARYERAVATPGGG